MPRALLSSSTSHLYQNPTTLRLFLRPTLSRASSSSPASTSLQHESPLLRYDSLIQSGALNHDDHQRTILMKLDALHEKLENYQAPRVPESLPGGETAGFLSRLFRGGSSRDPSQSSNSLTIPEDAPRGVYMYGSVGTGKSMLMDIFYSTVAKHSSRRVHFHAFMIDVHKRNHAYKLKAQKHGDHLGEVARDLAKEATVLCFDEFQVTDITDAMILRNLLERLMGYGVVLVMTSNRHPDQLYKNGLQRESFIPCIDLIKERLEVVDLTGEDYRNVPTALKEVYFQTSRPGDAKAFKAAFDLMTSSPFAPSVKYNREIEVWGRKLAVPKSSSAGTGVAWFRFEDLCGGFRGAADYIEIAKEFGTIFVEGVPTMNLDTKDRARRFITFIDACYESKTKLFLLADAPMKSIFSGESSEGIGMDDSPTLGRPEVLDDISGQSEKGLGSMFTGEEEVFAFRRCQSRLTEMAGERWALLANTGAGGSKNR